MCHAIKLHETSGAIQHLNAYLFEGNNEVAHVLVFSDLSIFTVL